MYALIPTDPFASALHQIGDRGRTGFGLFLLSWVALAEGAYAEADELLRESAALSNS